jgi:hypothetical protein
MIWDSMGLYGNQTRVEGFGGRRRKERQSSTAIKSALRLTCGFKAVGSGSSVPEKSRRAKAAASEAPRDLAGGTERERILVQISTLPAAGDLFCLTAYSGEAAHLLLILLE